MIDAPVFEPRFYERAAQRHLSHCYVGPVFTNLAWGLEGNPTTRPELDAAIVQHGRVTPAEIKAHLLTQTMCAEIAAKHTLLGFRDLIIVGPAVEVAAERWCAASTTPRIELICFRPDLDEIGDWYGTAWPDCVPEWVLNAMATGRHHFRFVLTRRTDRGRFVIGQQRTRIYAPSTIRRLLDRLPSPPARILWTPQRFTIPRDLIARRSSVTPLGGYVPVDIDGDRLHVALHACTITAEQPVCVHCLRHANHELRRLAAGVSTCVPTAVLASGGRGLHVYYPDEPGVRATILDLANGKRVRIDESVTASIKTTIALPGSLHGGTARPVIAADVEVPC